MPDHQMPEPGRRPAPGRLPDDLRAWSSGMSSAISSRLPAVTSSASSAAASHAGARVRTAGRAARQESLREHNLSLTLQKIVDAVRPVSRADISAATGLARATVSGLVDQLIEVSGRAEGHYVCVACGAPRRSTCSQWSARMRR